MITTGATRGRLIGKGTQGKVYEVAGEPDRVVKVTTSRREYETALELLEASANEGHAAWKGLFCTVYSARRTGRYYEIVKERVEPLPVVASKGFCPVRYTQTHLYLQGLAYRTQILECESSFEPCERQAFRRFLEIVDGSGVYKGDIAGNLGRTAAGAVVLFDWN